MAGKATPSGGIEAEHRGIFPTTARVRRGSPIAMLICLLASSCSQTAASPPITPDQHAQLAELAAGPDSPEGLGGALAAVEATRKMQDCRASMNETAGQMKTMGAVNGAVGIAGRMAGPGGKTAAKMVAVGIARAVRGKLSRQMQSC
ncbi:hypothetical protein [Mesorhizobium sp. M7A.F.Ca.US.011.01.1.1]|uniref:hypothetical protein n=1 Tax=Mesorhizobium sp. M7A.F.Ca.US.011.01.1.1 TaxID=2496741 RepID=UPI0013E2F879|nr:hypothetical protein [Mesorhizobium sp. M7A.F.Ca.US.011.01.1.1]